METSPENIFAKRISILSYIRKEKREHLEKLMQEIVREHLVSGDLKWISDFFAPIYQEVQEDLFLKKIDLKRKTKFLLEALALSYDPKTPEEKYKIYTKIIEGDAYYRKKKRLYTTSEHEE